MTSPKWTDLDSGESADLGESSELTEDEFVSLNGVVFDGETPCEPPRELVKGLLPFYGLAFIGGQSGAAKTFIAVDLAVAHASAVVGEASSQFFGRKIRERVGVVILAAEGVGTLAHRLEVARRNRGVTEPLPIAYMADFGDLSDETDIAMVLAKLKLINARFREKWNVRLGIVIIDTVAAAFSLDDENDNAEASFVIRQMRLIGQRLDALVVAVHHYGKAADTGLRGASAFRAGADVVISVLADRDQITGDVGNRQIALAKSRTAEEGPISGFDLRFVGLGIDEDGDEFGSCAVIPNEAPILAKSGRREARSKVNFRAAFQDALAVHGAERPDVTGDSAVRAVDVRHVREALGRRSATGVDDPKKRADSIRRAMARAIRDLGAEFDTGFADGVEWIWSAQ